MASQSEDWEEVETQPILGNGGGLTNNNNSNNARQRQSLADDSTQRSSLDPNDTTLPLPDDIQARLLNNNNKNNNMSNNAANNNGDSSPEEECQRLIQLLENIQQHETMTLDEINVAQLINYLSRLYKGGGGNDDYNYNANNNNNSVDSMDLDDNNNEGPSANTTNTNSNEQQRQAAVKWNKHNVQLVRLAVKVAIQQSSSSSSSSTGGSGVGSKFVMRLLKDGILPITSSSTSSNNNGIIFGGNSTSNSNSNTTPSCVWIAKLVKSIIIEDLLPLALLVSVHDDDGNNSNNKNSSNNGGDTTAIDVLLSSFLLHLDTNELSQILPPSFTTDDDDDDDDDDEKLSNSSSVYGTVDDILDHLCGVTVSTTNNKRGGQQWQGLCPSAMAAILAALREFESTTSSSSNNTGSIGSASAGQLQRLSRKRVWKRCCGANNNNTNTNIMGLSQQQRGKGANNNLLTTQRYECEYVYVDRPTYLLQNGLLALKSLSISSSGDDEEGGGGEKIGDFDALPSLVYQLGKLPMSTTCSNLVAGGARGNNSSISSSSISGDKKNKKKNNNKGENEKQRGIRLRRMVLEGIATVLAEEECSEDDAMRSSSGHEGIVLGGGDGDDDDNSGKMKTKKKKNSQATNESYKWAKYTSLNHIGQCCQSDPEMSKAVLSLLSGEVIDTTSFVLPSSSSGNKRNNESMKHQQQQHQQKPFRYARLTPFILAISLSMASSVPRMRTVTLSAIRDLILEEETIRMKRMDGPWMDCLVRCLEMEQKKKKKDVGGGKKKKKHKDNDSMEVVVADPKSTTNQNDSGIGHVLSCLISVAKFVASELNTGDESILQALSQLGFLLIDCVKKDDNNILTTTTKSSSTTMQPSFASNVVMQATPVLATNLDISSYTSSNGSVNSSSSKVETSAPHATAAIGRFLLSYLYYQAASASSHFTSSSLASLSNVGGSSSGSDKGLCREVLRTSFDKFCGMAPNSLEYALLLKDLLTFSPLPMKHLLMDDEGSGGDDGNMLLGDMEGLDDDQKQMVIAYNLTSNHLPALIDTLANIPNGGMHPTVASQAIVPTIGRLLLLMATSRIGFGTLWKRHDLEDHVNHAFLLAKKSLFSPDAEKRKCAANVLVMLLGVAGVAAALTSSNSSRSVWNSMVYDMKGCLRRCLTQHQLAVRMEVYSSLLALLPKSNPGVNGDLSAASQESASPASSTASGGSRSPLSAAASTKGNAYNKILSSIPVAGQQAIVSIVSELLLSSLERYVTIPKEEFTDRNARRERSAMGVGLSQMEMVIEDNSPGPEGGDDEEKTNPFRFDKCISTRPSNSGNNGNGTKKKSKNTPIGQSLLAEALARIQEPLPFLVASCISVSPLMQDSESNDANDDDNQGNEMKKAIRRVRQQLAECDLSECTKWTKSCKAIVDIQDNIQRSEQMAVVKLATCILVSIVVDVLLSTVDWSKADTGSLVIMDGSGSGDVANEVENLFTLRTDAIDQAAIIMSSFVNAKPNAKKKAATKKEDKTKGKKKLKESTNTSSQSSEGLLSTQEEKKKSAKSSTASGGVTITKVREKDIKDATRFRNKKLIEDTVNNISPAMSSDFLAESLRKFGAEVMKKVRDNEDSDDDDEEEDGEATSRLAKCYEFRRYVITKSLLYMSGSSFIVKAGARFTPLSLGSSSGSGEDEKTVNNNRVATSLSLGPLLFVEFCSHCYELEQTSIVSSGKSSSTTFDLSLAQLSMRAFTSCLRGITSDIANHPMSKAKRAWFLLSSAIRKVSGAIPCSKDGWKYYQDLDNNDSSSYVKGVTDDEMNLSNAFMSILSPAKTSSDSESSTHVCLFTELLSNCMYGEATECCYLISAATQAFNEANIKENLGVSLLRGFEFDAEEGVGVLGLDHSDDSNDNNACVSAAVGVAMKLNSCLDGNTHVPLSTNKEDKLRVARSIMGLPTSSIQNWPERHHGRLEKETIASGTFGIPTQVAGALTATLGVGEHFRDTCQIPSKKELKLALIKLAAQTSDANFAKEKSSIASTISSAIDVALNNADFVISKVIPHICEGSYSLAQRFVSSLLYSVCKMISASAPSAEFMDNGTFMSNLLKSTKRLYGILAKLMLSFINNVESLMSCKETTNLLDYLTGTLMPRVSSLLLTLQGLETDGKNFLAESKIESHGKTAAMLVFEKEKLDNALLKVGAKMKASKLEEDQEWLEDHVVSNLTRSFTIENVEDAMAKEAPKKKKAVGTKRKVKSEPKEKKKKKPKRKKKEVDYEEEEDNDSDNVTDGEPSLSVDAEDSMDEDGSDVVDLEQLTAQMKEEDDSDDEDGSSDEDSGDESE